MYHLWCVSHLNGLQLSVDSVDRLWPAINLQHELPSLSCVVPRFLKALLLCYMTFLHTHTHTPTHHH